MGARERAPASSSLGRRSASSGLGRIGAQVARRALGLGMRVVAYDPYVSADRFRELGVEPAATLDELYAEADLITLHLPLNRRRRAGCSTRTRSRRCGTACGS